jgi:hypothetical protein
MSNRVAMAIGAAILAGLVVDVALNGAAATQFLLQKLIAAVEWLVFWR